MRTALKETDSTVYVCSGASGSAGPATDLGKRIGKQTVTLKLTGILACGGGLVAGMLMPCHAASPMDDTLRFNTPVANFDGMVKQGTSEDAGAGSSKPGWINPGVPWPATDALGRELPLAAEVGPPKKDRFMGIYYLGWTGDVYSYEPYDVTKILAEHPDAPKAVPRLVLGLTGDPVQFDFKWLDNIALPLPDDLSVFYTDGDTAPLGRFRFRYITK